MRDGDKDGKKQRVKNEAIILKRFSKTPRERHGDRDTEGDKYTRREKAAEIQGEKHS